VSAAAFTFQSITGWSMLPNFEELKGRMSGAVLPHWTGLVEKTAVTSESGEQVIPTMYWPAAASASFPLCEPSTMVC